MPDSNTNDTTQERAEFTNKVHLWISDVQNIKLEQIRLRRGPKATRNALIREAITQFISRQEDVVGSRAHFNKTLQEKFDSLQEQLLTHLNSALQKTGGAEGTTSDTTLLFEELLFLMQTMISMNAMAYSVMMPKFQPDTKLTNTKAVIEEAMLQAQQESDINHRRVQMVRQKVKPIKG